MISFVARSIAFSLFFAAQAPSYAEELCISHIQVVDVARGQLTPPSNVKISGSKITAIDQRPCPPGKRTIEGRNQFLAPGLIDTHVHTDLWHYQTQPDEYALAMNVLNGVTTVRDAAGSPLVVKLKNEVLEGKRFGPSFEIASTFITSNPKASDNTTYIATPEDAKNKLAEFKSIGYSSVKVEVDLKPEIYEASATAAQHNGLYLFGHPLVGHRADNTAFVRFDETLRHHRTLEHLNWTFGDILQDKDSPWLREPNERAMLWLAFTRLDPAKIPGVIAKLKAAGSIVSPTLSVVQADSLWPKLKAKFEALGSGGFASDPILKYLPSYVYNDWQEIFKSWNDIYTPIRLEQMRISLKNAKTLLTAFDRAGIPMLTGTDAPARPFILHGFALHDELKLMVNSGVSVASVIRAATQTAAIAMGKRGYLGEVRPGAQADLLILTRNPLLSIENLRSYQSMVLRGEYLDKTRLQKEWDDLYRRSHSLAQQGTNAMLKVSAQIALERKELKE